jgi:hypothetical protein
VNAEPLRGLSGGFEQGYSVGADLSGSTVAVNRQEEAMTFSRKMILTHPGEIDIDTDALSRCIDDCLSCGQACTACAYEALR